MTEQEQLAAQRKRIQELLEANNHYVEKYRAVKQEMRRLTPLVSAAMLVSCTDGAAGLSDLKAHVDELTFENAPHISSAIIEIALRKVS